MPLLCLMLTGKRMFFLVRLKIQASNLCFLLIAYDAIFANPYGCNL